MKKVNIGQVIGGVVVIGSLCAIALQATRADSSVTFFTPAEVYADPAKFEDRRFRVSGLVLGGTKEWDAESKLLTFRMTDLKGHEFRVRYLGVPPDLFKEGQGVVVEGKLAGADLAKDNTLHANLLMVKHSEVYDTQKDHSQLREARLMDSITKGQSTTAGDVRSQN